MKVLFGSLLLILLLAAGGFYLQSQRESSPGEARPTSIISDLLQTEPTPTPDPTISILFTGDVMLDRNIRLKAQQIGYESLIGPELKSLMNSADIAVVNLEGPVTTEQSLSVGSQVGSPRNFLFTFAPESLTALTSANVSLVNLGNNHILNFGTDGLAETYQHLDAAGIKYFGFTGETQPQQTRTYTLEHNGKRIGFVNYNQFITNGETTAFEDIAALRPLVDYLVVYTHWGNEYVPENQVLISLAHRFVDEGADLVIGSHPHVVTGHEVYKDKHIYYSLGNFIFDQYFDEDVKKGLVVLTTIDPSTKVTTTAEYQVSIQPTGITELVPTPAQ